MFKITQQYGRAPETTLNKKVNNFNEAKAAVDEMLIKDVSMNVQVTYRIYDFDELKGEFDSSKIDISMLQGNEKQDESSQGKGSTAGFRPSPLSTSPRPPGMPQNWKKDEDEDK